MTRATIERKWGQRDFQVYSSNSAYLSIKQMPSLMYVIVEA